MGFWETVLAGCVGALVAYIGTELHGGRIQQAIESNRYRVLIADSLLYVLAGGLVAAFFVEPANRQGAAISGAGWELIVGRYLSRPEKTTIKDDDGWNEPA